MRLYYSLLIALIVAFLYNSADYRARASSSVLYFPISFFIQNCFRFLAGRVEYLWYPESRQQLLVPNLLLQNFCSAFVTVAVWQADYIMARIYSNEARNSRCWQTSLNMHCAYRKMHVLTPRKFWIGSFNLWKHAHINQRYVQLNAREHTIDVYVSQTTSSTESI